MAYTHSTIMVKHLHVKNELSVNKSVWSSTGRMLMTDAVIHTFIPLHIFPLCYVQKYWTDNLHPPPT